MWTWRELQSRCHLHGRFLSLCVLKYDLFHSGKQALLKPHHWLGLALRQHCEGFSGVTEDQHFLGIPIQTQQFKTEVQRLLFHPKGFSMHFAISTRDGVGNQGTHACAYLPSKSVSPYLCYTVELGLSTWHLSHSSLKKKITPVDKAIEHTSTVLGSYCQFKFWCESKSL